MYEYYNIIANIFLQSVEQINKRASKNIDINILAKKFKLDISKDSKNIIKKSKLLSYSIDKYSEEKIIEKNQANVDNNIINSKKEKKKKFKHNHQNKSKQLKNKTKQVNNVNQYVNTPLESIFNIFRYNKNQTVKLIYNIDIQNKLLKMPVLVNDLKNEKKDYDTIILELNKVLTDLLKNEDLNSIIDLIEKTMSTVPCKLSGEQIYDISLYDNTKLIAALAGCNYYFSKEENLEENEQQYILVSADISGIQNFIYTIASKGALKALRGRSFYLEIIFENIIDEILTKIGLCRANLLYSGGGHFYMLLPNTKRVKSIIEDAKININQWFLETYGTSLYIEISYVMFSEDTLCSKDDKLNSIGQIYKDVGAKNSKGKLQRYNKVQLEQLMLYSENQQDESECSICHKSFKLNEDNICENCSNISYLGNNLPKIQDGDKVILIQEFFTDKSLRIPSIDKNKKLYLSLREKDKLSKEQYVRMYSINSNNLYLKNKININAGIYSKKIAKGQNLITFDELANMSKGIKRVGVLRADVDNLGKAFTEGFELDDESDKYKYISLSRNSNLSYSLSKFFKFGINKICEGSFSQDRFRILEDDDTSDRNVAIVYAGGDDLFIVGAWNEIIELAVDINNQFKKFTNNKMTLSAGVGIFNSKYPIEQMASQVGELEHIAKISGKDRICLFDYMPENLEHNLFNEDFKYRHLYTWEEFENSVCKEKIRMLYKWFDFENNDKSKLDIGMSLLYKLLGLVREIKSGDRINLARIAYLIGRLEAGKNKKELYIEFKETFYKWVLNQKDLRQLETALTLIIYLNRKDEKNE